MPVDGVTLHGPLGEFARELSPLDDLYAEEVYAAALSVWSTAIAPTVKVQSYLPGLRPPLVWTAFVGDSWNPPQGPELSVVRGLRMRQNFTSVADCNPVNTVVHLFAAVDSARRYPSLHTSALRSTLLNSSPFGWTRGGKPQLQSELNHALRQAWDGSNFLSAGREKRTPVQREQDRIPPMVGALWSIDEGAWNQRPYAPGDDAFYSRFLPIKLRGRPRAGRPALAGPPPALIDAYAWAVSDQRQVQLSDAAAAKWGAVRALESAPSDTLDKEQAAFTLRVGEHTLRIAAGLAVAEMSTVIHHDMIEAAWSLVRRSILDASDLSKAGASRFEEPMASVGMAMRATASSDITPAASSWHTEESEADLPDAPVQRRTSVVQTQDRDTRVTRQVKNWYDGTCQFCGTVLELPVPPYTYSEAAHIQALGAPHNGPDRIENVLCLCPNCHIRFDRGARVLTDDLRVIDAVTGEDLGALTVHPQHRIRLSYVQQHRARWDSNT
ncbi:HNH endonuclease [Streptomyces microflavus]|uniref:HNH endonuclease n=1 Tax=Streptomyces microflavus TaxID=1919 RepID=UPI0033B653D8